MDATIALMYHALGETDGVYDDPHYTVAMPRFLAQLALCRQKGGAVVSARDWLAGKPGVIFTFDDGHASNHRRGLPALAEAGATADFFVNPAQVGTAGFATWAELREMSDAGMSIQSHGLDHREFLTELSPARLREDLKRARLEIEEHVGKPVTLLAPAGGREPPRLEDVAREVGYTHVMNSRPAPVTRADGPTLGRLAVTSQLDDATLSSWLDRGWQLRRAQLRFAALDLAKRALGDDLYRAVRKRLLP
ncbi:MAG TPA: polysaccharide deacetylase family protein [Polyangia bacterium]|nr:polysaccharide deacetylase family protein [Polyangia bacterium]